MIRLPSFFKRKTQADDLEFGSGGRRSTKRAAPASNVLPRLKSLPSLKIQNNNVLVIVLLVLQY